MKRENGSGEQQAGSHRYWCLSEPQFAPQDGPMFALSLTDEGADAPAFPSPHRPAGPWGRCTSQTTGRLPQAQSTSPTSAPAACAAGDRLPRQTAQTHSLTSRLDGRRSTGVNLASTPTCTWSHQFSSVMLFYKTNICGRKWKNRVVEEKQHDFGSHHSSENSAWMLVISFYWRVLQSSEGN